MVKILIAVGIGVGIAISPLGDTALAKILVAITGG